MRSVAIVIGRCSRVKQLLGIRMERKGPNQWSATWSFAIKDAVAKREGYATTQLQGEFLFDETFPGCPHCNSKGFFCCECGKVACYSLGSNAIVCPWCGMKGEVSGQAKGVAAGGDR